MNKSSCQEFCQLKYSECFVCSHVFNCDCMDFLTKNIPCKHIHLVQRFRTLHEKVELGSEQIPHADNTLEIEKTLSVLKGSEPIDIDRLKLRITSNLTEMLGRVNSSSILDEEALRSLDKYITAATHTF